MNTFVPQDLDALSTRGLEQTREEYIHFSGVCARQKDAVSQELLSELAWALEVIDAELESRRQEIVRQAPPVGPATRLGRWYEQHEQALLAAVAASGLFILGAVLITLLA